MNEDEDIGHLVYKTDIDYERLNSMTPAEVIQYAEDEFSVPMEGSMSFKSMGRTMLQACEVEKLRPDNEQLLFILSNMNRILCESCAGSGKTTMSQMAILKYKLVYRMNPDEMLCIAYNTNAVKDMQERHSALVVELNAYLKKQYEESLAAGKTTKLWKDVMISPLLKFSTMHALAREWIVTYADRFRIDVGDFFLGEAAAFRYMEKSVGYAMQENPQQFRHCKNGITPRMVENLQRVYCYAMETLTMENPAAWAQVMPSVNSPDGLTIEETQLAFGCYERYKKSAHRMDFNDTLRGFYNLLKDPIVCERVRKNYKIILVDEYQDITPSMLRIIRIIAEGATLPNGTVIPRYDDLKLICVGDTDQSIYGYRGTDPRNCVRFKYDYLREGISDARILSMSVNRRCATEILEQARKVIETSSERIAKPIRGLRTGGKVVYKYYTSEEEQMEMILGILRDMDAKERGDTVICYHNNSSARLVSSILFDAQIPFKNLKSNQDLFSDKMSQFVKEAMSLFRFPRSKEKQKFIFYRILPTGYHFKKADLVQAIDSTPDETPFWEIDFGAFGTATNNFGVYIHTLYDSYLQYKGGKGMIRWVPPLLKMFKEKKNIFLRESWRASDTYYKFIEDWYTQDTNVYDFQTATLKTDKMFAEAIDAGLCVKLSTFHGLKGLEFKNVIIMDFAQDQIPGNEHGREERVYVKTALEYSAADQESIRLFYVAMTRAKDCCYILSPQISHSSLMLIVDEDLAKREQRNKPADEYDPRGLFIPDDTDVSNLTLDDADNLPSLDDLLTQDYVSPIVNTHIPDKNQQQASDSKSLLPWSENPETETVEPTVETEEPSKDSTDLITAYFSDFHAAKIKENPKLTAQANALLSKMISKTGGTT